MKQCENMSIFMSFFSLLCFSCSDHSNLKRMEFVNNASFMVFIVFLMEKKCLKEKKSMCTMIQKDITVPKLLLLTSPCGKTTMCVRSLTYTSWWSSDRWLAAELVSVVFAWLRLTGAPQPGQIHGGVKGDVGRKRRKWRKGIWTGSLNTKR